MAIKNLILLKPYFLLLLIVPFLLLLLKKNHKKQNSAIRLTHLEFLTKSFSSNKLSFFNYKKFAYFYGIWALLCLAASDPNLVSQNKKTDVIGYDLMLLIDTSLSMKALDFSTETEFFTRLDVTKKTVSSFIKERSNDRIGIIIFGDFAYLESPLTIDNISLTNILENIEIGSAGARTAIGDAITLATKKLHKKEKNSRAIILLTDGENTAGKIKPLTASSLAKKYDIPIYTIGIGSNKEAPFINDFGQLQYSFVTLDIITLKEIAKSTGGKFYNAKNEKELNKIYKEINKLTKTKAESKIFIEYEAIFHKFIYAALLLLGLYFIFSLRNNIFNLLARK